MERFLRVGFARTTVEEIADAAGVSRMTVFRHFGRKDDIVFAGSRRRLRALETLIRESGPTTAAELHLCLVEFVADLASTEDFGRWMRIVDGDRELLARGGLLRWDMESLVADELAKIGGLDAPDLRVRVSAASAIGAVFMAARESYRHRGDFVSLTRQALYETRVPGPTTEQDSITGGSPRPNPT